MATEYIGSSPSNRPDYIGGWLAIVLESPAAHDGTMTEAEVYLHSDPPLDGCTIGVWYLVSGSTWKCRSGASLGNIGSGYSKVTGLSLAVQVGDCIGVCCPQDKGSNQVDETRTGETGYLRAVAATNKNIAGTQVNMTSVGSSTVSARGLVEYGSPPTMSTTGIYGLGTEEATARGEITATGGENADERGFVYGKTSQADPGGAAPDASGYDHYVNESGSFGAESYDLTLTSLDELTTYYFRAYAHNSYGYDYGPEIQFSNDPVGFEKLTPNAAGDETNIPDGGSPHYSMCASVDAAFVDPGTGFGYFTGNYVQVLDVGTGRDLYNLSRPYYRDTGIVKVKYRSRVARTTYPYGNGKGSIKTHSTVYESTIYGLSYWTSSDQGWFRELLINAEVRVWRNNPFTSSAWTLEEIDALQAGIWLENEAGWDDPICDQVHIIVCWVDAEVGNEAVAARGPSTATLQAEVIEDEGDTEVLKPKDGIQVYFQWGETAAYGNTTSKQTGKTKGDTFTANISGLDGATSYHFRAVIETSDGETFYGTDTETGIFQQHVQIHALQ